jgi:hypothetical protein
VRLGSVRKRADRTGAPHGEARRVTPLGTLDALHLATALVWRDRMGKAPVVATHDESLAVASPAFGLEVLGA